MRVVTSNLGRLNIADHPSTAWPDDGGPAGRPLPFFDSGQVHELLAAEHVPRRVAAWLGQTTAPMKAVVWCEPSDGLYPPALVAAGIAPGRLHVLRPAGRAEALWAITESLRCSGVGITIAVPPRMTVVEARRLQLAAERGGGIGLLLRVPDNSPHAARTRWAVTRQPGDALVQRWRLKLVYGQGRPVGHEVVVEVDRETHHVRANAGLGDRTRQTPPAVATG